MTKKHYCPLRVQPVQRRVLPRRAATVQTPLGPVRCKWAGGRCKAEYDDLARIAQQTGRSLHQVRQEIAASLAATGEEETQ